MSCSKAVSSTIRKLSRGSRKSVSKHYSSTVGKVRGSKVFCCSRSSKYRKNSISIIDKNESLRIYLFLNPYSLRREGDAASTESEVVSSDDITYLQAGLSLFLSNPY